MEKSFVWIEDQENRAACRLGCIVCESTSLEVIAMPLKRKGRARVKVVARCLKCHTEKMLKYGAPVGGKKADPGWVIEADHETSRP